MPHSDDVSLFSFLFIISVSVPQSKYISFMCSHVPRSRDCAKIGFDCVIYAAVFYNSLRDNGDWEEEKKSMEGESMVVNSD